MEHLQDIWPKWTIEEKIGEGAYGKVYKIRHEEIGGALAALKIIEFPKNQSEIRELLNSGMDYQSIREYYEDLRNNLINEIQIMESLKTASSIVSIEDYSFRDHKEDVGCTIYIRMELLESLNDILQKEGELPVSEVIKLGCDICQALECCESEKIIHRDIKPDNVFRNRYGSYKLGDFGISKQIMETRSAVAETKTGTGMYMAPEVYRGERYDRTVDIYSLGIMLYRLLNGGRFPFMPPAPQRIRPADAEEAMRKRMNGERMTAPARANDNLAMVLARAIAFESKQRYQHAAEFREALINCQNSKSEGAQRIQKEAPFQEDSVEKIYSEEKTYNAWGENKTTDSQQKNGVSEQSVETGASHIEKVEEKQDNSNQSVPAQEGIKFYRATLDEEYSTSRPHKVEKDRNVKWFNVVAAMGFLLLLIVIVFVYNAYQRNHEDVRNDAYIRAYSYLDNEDFEEAIKSYSDLVDEYPVEEEGYIGLADAYIGLNDYKSALQILEEGKRVTVSSADIESKYEEVKNLNDYYTKIDTAQGSVDAGNLEQAEVEYKEALKIDDTRAEAYEGICNLYISQERYDEAVNSIEPVSKIDLFEFKDLKEKCWLSKVNKMMTDSDYNGLLQYFKNDRSLLHTNDLYFQDGNVVESIEDGAGIILSDYGVYAGEISNNQRSGNGKQFGTYSSDSTYSVTAGQWSNDRANGQCTYSYVDTVDSSRTETVVGNVTDNLFNGDLIFNAMKSDGNNDSFAAYAENGTLRCIRVEEGNKYVYGESASGWYWYYDTEESLQGHGIWSAY